MDSAEEDAERIGKAINEASAIILGLESLRGTTEPAARRIYIDLAKSAGQSLANVLQAIEVEEVLRRKRNS